MLPRVSFLALPRDIAMDYESFRMAWTQALREPRLPTLDMRPEETLDTRYRGRKHNREVHGEHV